MKRICPVHGIYEKHSKQDRCPKCAKQSQKLYDKSERDKENMKFYQSAAWKKVRKIQLTQHPLCIVCKKPATIVDHIIEIRDGGSKLSLSNLQSMCVSCHNAKTAAAKIQRGGQVKSLQTDSPYTDAPPKISQSPFSRGTL